MAKIGILTLKGESGTEYKFNVYPIDTEFKDIGAVYYISKRTEKSNGTGNHAQIYIGQTGDLSERFDNHHKEDCFVKNKANCISIHQEDDEDNRFSIETDLIRAHAPPCNS